VRGRSSNKKPPVPLDARLQAKISNEAREATELSQRNSFMKHRHTSRLPGSRMIKVESQSAIGRAACSIKSLKFCIQSREQTGSVAAKNRHGMLAWSTKRVARFLLPPFNQSQIHKQHQTSSGVSAIHLMTGCFRC
jgi:hypothetical protein